jgi:AcrR family transcriptional regulator
MAKTSRAADELPPARPPRDSARTRRSILLAATEEFAELGYSGARVERIVARATTNMRLVYHHFGSKAGLYAAVIEHIYEQIREQEGWLDLDEGEPLDAMRRLVEFTIAHFQANPAFLKLTTFENLQKGSVVAKSTRIKALSAPLIGKIKSILCKGEKSGCIRQGIDPLQIYISIVSLACHHINNVHTLSATFSTDMSDAQWQAARRAHVIDLVMIYLTAPGGTR